MFRDAKVGDRVWDFLYGYGKVVEVNKDELWVEFQSLYFGKKRVYTFDGILRGVGLPQTLFWNEVKLEIPEKPFSLEDELRKLEVVEFKNEYNNYSIYWSNNFQKIRLTSYSNIEIPMMKYFSKESAYNFKKSINNKKITKEQFFEAYKNVFGGRND